MQKYQMCGTVCIKVLVGAGPVDSLSVRRISERDLWAFGCHLLSLYLSFMPQTDLGEILFGCCREWLLQSKRNGGMLK